MLLTKLIGIEGSREYRLGQINIAEKNAQITLRLLSLTVVDSI
jgi:hypothetical protein